MVKVIFNYISGSHSQVFYKKAVLKYFTKFTEKHLCRSLFLIKIQLYHEKMLTQESNLTTLKHAKDAILLWSILGALLLKAHQAR